MSETQTQHATIHAAFAAAQGEFPTIVKNRTAKVKSKRTNAEFEYSYCTLDAIFEAVRPALSKHGLALRHVVTKENCTIVEAVLSFGAGEEIRSGPLPIPNFDGDMQALGSGLTYARRYTVTALLGICAEEDDDAQQTPPRGSDNPYRDQQREREQAKAAEPPKEDPAEKTINTLATAAELASYVLQLIGKHPVKDNARRWKEIGIFVTKRLAASGWTDLQKATVEAVLEGVRAQLRPATQPESNTVTDTVTSSVATSSAKGDPSKAPPFERLAGWIDQSELPADVEKAILSMDSSTKFLDLRADAVAMVRVIDHALNLLQENTDKEVWPLGACSTASQAIYKVKAKYELEADSIEAFGGGPDSATPAAADSAAG